MPNSADHAPSEPDSFAAKVRVVLDGWASLHEAPRVTVAFSGGLDSTVLLATLCRVEAPARIRAAHVDHGLNPRSGEWSEHCARVAADHGVEFVGVRVAVDRASGEGLEAAAREARYGALRDLLVPGEWLLTAHHADDQLETVLLRMLRGTGIRGLRGIIGFGPFGAGWLGRPLLGFVRGCAPDGQAPARG
jgi:tRNA(Ile)-lysidine synthase